MLAYEDGIAALEWRGHLGFVSGRACWGRMEARHGEMDTGGGMIMLATPTPDYESP